MEEIRMQKKQIQKKLALFLVLAMLVTILPGGFSNQVLAATEGTVIYQNDFETDSTAVTIGDTKALEFDAAGDVTNSWVTVFQKDLNFEYTDKLYSGATLSFDLYLPAGTTYTGSLKAQAVTKMGASWTWTQSNTIADVGSGAFTDSGNGYIVAKVSIPFGSEIEAAQGLKSIVPCLAASNCDYTGKVYLDNVKLVNGASEPVVGTTIYQNDFETDSTAVTIGDTKALEFDVAGDVTNSWVTVFQKDLNFEYTDKLYSGATLSFDLYLPAGSTFTGSLKAQAVTKMGASWTWTQSNTISDVGIGTFTDSGNGYLVAEVSIPFGSEIEAIQGLKSIIPSLAASNCDYVGKIYLDNVKLVNGAGEPAVGTTIYQNDFETDSTAVTIGDTKALEFDAAGDAANSWISIFQKDLAFEYADKLYSGATLNFDLYLPAGSTFTGSLKAQAVTKMGASWTWTQSNTIADIGISKFTDSGNGYLIANVSIPFGSEIEAVQGLKSIIPCLAASNCDYVGKIYLDNVKLVNGISQGDTEVPAVNPITYTFDSADSISGWSNGGNYQYSGGLAIGYAEPVSGDGTMKLDVDYSGNSTTSWSEAKVAYTFGQQQELNGYNQFSFDFIYDPACMTTGSFSSKLSAGIIDTSTALDTSKAVDYGTGLKKINVVIEFASAANSVSNFIIGLVGSNTDYKGSFYIDNVAFKQIQVQDIYVNATKTIEVQTPVAVNADSITANGVTQATSSQVKLVDDEAIAATSKLYAYLQAVGNTDSVLFGHQNDIHHKAGNKTLSNSDTKDVTGSISAVVGIDALSLTGNELPNATWDMPLADRVAACAKVAKAASDQGAIITLSAHMPNFAVIDQRVKNNVPGSTDSTKVGILSDGSYNFSGYTPNTVTGNVVARIMPGKDLNYLYTAYLDMIAAYAKALEKDNISVMFRPFHENTGSWFWWGAAFCDQEQYKNLYKYTVEYLRDVKDVHNFIYVYGPSSDAASTADYEKRYPGDDYVDMVGFDMYHQNPAVGDNFIEQFKTELSIVEQFATEHNKLFAVTETGVANGSSALLKSGNERKDWYNEILDAVAPSKAAYFLLWANFGTDSGFYTPYVVSKTDTTIKGHEMLDNFIDFYNDPRSVFANELGSYTNISTTVTPNTGVTGYITAPTSGSRILSAVTIEASVKNAADDSVVKFVATDKNGSVVKEITATKNENGKYTGELTSDILAAFSQIVGTISLVVDGTVYNTINAKFNMPEPVVDPTVVDTFEYYYGENDVLAQNWSTGKGTGCTIVPTLSDKSYDGSYGLEFKYSLTSSSGYAGVTKNLDGLDWSGKNALQLWTIPDGKNQKIVVQITSGNNVFEVYLNQYADYQNKTTPVLVTIPFSSFVGRDNKSAVFDASSIQSFGLWCNAIVPVGGDAATYKLDSVIYYDSIKAVTSDATAVTFTPDTPAVLLGDVNGDNSIDAIDFALLKMYLLDPSISINEKNSDINGDGEINAVDFAQLKIILLNM
jgi:mannan endo-1,4-beta-mannosidase